MSPLETDTSESRVLPELLCLVLLSHAYVLVTTFKAFPSSYVHLIFTAIHLGLLISPYNMPLAASILLRWISSSDF